MSGLGRALHVCQAPGTGGPTAPSPASCSSSPSTPHGAVRLIIYINSSFGAPYELLAAKLSTLRSFGWLCTMYTDGPTTPNDPLSMAS